MKRLLLSLMLLAASLASFAHDFEVDGIYYDKLTASTCAVTYKGSSYMNKDYSGNVIIPSQVTYMGATYAVTSIGRSAFYGCSSLTSITIPNSVTSIGDGAFRGCSSLTSITIPNSVTRIGDDAFRGCSSLTSITIPNSVTSIGNWTFDGCSSLSSVTISCKDENDFSNYVQRTDIYEIFHYDGLRGKKHAITIGGTERTSITIPNSVTSIESYAFNGCSSLTSITIPNSVTSIGSVAFYDCM